MRTAAKLWAWSAALLLAAPLSAIADTTRYVDYRIGQDVSAAPDSGTWGRSTTSPWRTIAFANRSLPAPNTSNGHVILRIAGDGQYQYDALPLPVNACANGKRYFIYGGTVAGDLADSTQTLLPSGTLTRPYVSYVGVTFADGAAQTLAVIDSAQRDTVRNSVINAQFYLRSSYWNLFNTRLLGPVIRVATTGVTVKGTTISGCTSNTLIGQPGDPYSNNSGVIWSATGKTDSCSQWFNNWAIRYLGGASRAYSEDYAQHFSSRGNHITIYAASGGTTPAWGYRNQCWSNNHDCDTVIVYGSPSAEIWMTQGGTSNHDSGYQTFDSCYFQSPKFNWNGANNRLRGDSFTYTSFVASGSPVPGEFATGDSNTVNHCTFVGGTAKGGLIRIESGATWAAAASNNTGLTWTNNVIYTTADSGFIAGACSLPASRVRTGVFWGTKENASGGFTNRLTSDYNLFGYYGRMANRYDLPVMWRNSTGATFCSRVGTATAWDTLGSYDEHSKVGYPQFYDANYYPARVTPLDLRIGATSAAKGAGSGGSDMGAVAYPAAAGFLFVNDSTRTVFDSTSVADTASFNVQNIGTANLTASFASPPGAYSVSVDTSSILIAAGKRRAYIVTLTKPSYNLPAGTYTVYLNMATNDPVVPTRRFRFNVQRLSFSIE